MKCFLVRRARMDLFLDLIEKEERRGWRCDGPPYLDSDGYNCQRMVKE